MSTVSFQLPSSIYEQAKMLAAREGVSLEEFLALAVMEKVATIETASYLKERAKRGSREKLLAVLGKAPDVEPEDLDRL
jgi:hypothetical protein